jgi:hypothetical protein
MIKVLYTCDQCGLIDRPVEVEERATEEDLTLWMHKVQIALSKDHDIVSPHCHITKFTNAKIPVAPGSNMIGQETRH